VSAARQWTLTACSSLLQAFAIAASRLSVSMIGVPSAACSANSLRPGAIFGAIVYKALNIWLVSQTDWSKLVLGIFIVLIVVVFPKGIVGVVESVMQRRRAAAPKAAALSAKMEGAQ